MLVYLDGIVNTPLNCRDELQSGVDVVGFFDVLDLVRGILL